MSKEFDLLKRVQELSSQQKEKQQYSFDGIITISNNLLLQKSDKTKEYLDKLRFFVLDLGEVFYKIRKIKQFFCNHYSINYDIFRESLDKDESELFGKFFGIKRKLQKSGIKISKEDNLFISEIMILSVVDSSKKKYLVSIENSKLINDFTKVIVELIQQQQKILFNKENKDSEIILFTIEKDDENNIEVSFKPVKLNGKFDGVVKDIFEDNYTKYMNDFETFVKYSEIYTSNNIKEIKKDILSKIKSVINKYDEENQDIVDDIISSVNTNSKSIETKKVEPKSQNIVSVDDILNELNGSNKNDTVNLDDLLSDTDDEEIPF